MNEEQFFFWIQPFFLHDEIFLWSRFRQCFVRMRLRDSRLIGRVWTGDVFLRGGELRAIISTTLPCTCVRYLNDSIRSILHGQSKIKPDWNGKISSHVSATVLEEDRPRWVQPMDFAVSIEIDVHAGTFLSRPEKRQIMAAGRMALLE